MNGGVADNETLDYATIQIIPSENRYEASVCCSNEVDALTDGILDSLLPHLPGLKELNAKGSNASIKLQLPESSADTAWFTKSTLSRFLHIAGLPDLMNIMKTMNEMAQLEETKKFHLVLYGQDQMSVTQEIGNSPSEHSSWVLTQNYGANLDGTSPKRRSGAEFASSAASKNELLRAMDLRLTALNRDLTAAFGKACGPNCTYEEISHLAKFLDHFGATNLKNCTCKYLELNQRSDTVYSINDDKHMVTSNSSNENSNNMYGNFEAQKSHSSTPVKYGVSPAKVAQVERQDSTGSEGSSDSSNEDGTPAERSRTMVRSAISRRSASPMRRIQIGRTGSRRVPALTIKSLNHLQMRENTFSQGDVAATSGGEEGSEPCSKKADDNVGRMSVQDAISLFEGKQRDETADTQKRRSLANITVGANKFVFRRWSTGMGEASTECQSGFVSDKSHPISHDLTEDVPKITEGEAGSDTVSSIDKTCITAEVDVKSENSEDKASDPQEIQAHSMISQAQEVVEKLTSNSEWNQRKEAELDQMLMKVMECKLATQKNFQANKKKDSFQANKKKDVNSEQRGELYDQYKAKRDEKRRVEEAKVKANKEAQTRGTRKIADDRKSKIASTEVKVKNKRATCKSEISHANLSKTEKPRKETSKSSMTGKVPSKTTPMTATRKSWPSTPSERSLGMTQASTNPTRQQTRPMSSFNRLNAKTERSLVQKKNVKETNDSGRVSKCVNEKKPATQTKNGKITKSKVTTPSGDSSLPVKSGIRDKVTKKSSIVPLELKSFHHKGSRDSLDSSPVVNKTKLSKSAGSVKKSQNLTCAQENEVTVSDLVSQPDKGDALLPFLCDSETLVNDQQQKSEKETSYGVHDDHDDLLQNIDKSSLEIVVEGESMIPSKSTEEIEEFQEIPASNDDISQLASMESTAPIRSPRVRLSLSQMLQEENSEPDNFDWGIAEIPPMMNYQRDAPKGFKRLLKFARKSKGEANLAGWSSPSVVSEGEDDSEESKALNSKKADSLLMKATQNSGLVKASQDKNFDSEKLYSGTFGAPNFNRKFQEIHDSAAGSTTKVARSFFSLSAFRGSKQNEPRLR